MELPPGVANNAARKPMPLESLSRTVWPSNETVQNSPSRRNTPLVAVAAAGRSDGASSTSTHDAM